MLQRGLSCLLLMLFSISSNADCVPQFSPPLSDRIANYNIDVIIDPTEKTIRANEMVTWTNTSPDTIWELRFYMYINAFKNTESTYLHGLNGSFFGSSILDRNKEDWGWIEIDTIYDSDGNFLVDSLRYIQPDDGNIKDQTVLQLRLVQPLLPGQTTTIDLHYVAKLPRTFVRVGYSKDDYYLFVQWFPKMGVYEQNKEGIWGWNCHQFMRQTEFYANFGVYEVSMTIPDNWVLGASGCLTGEEQIREGWKKYTYRAEDVIDFAWVLYPHFLDIRDEWNGIEIRLLIPPEHKHFIPRFLKATKSSLAYLDQYVGTYPYPVITVIDPPFHALRSGLMEYPMLITTGSIYVMPESFRSLESLVAHEFTHQYFMGMLASNEKEEPWLDEGLVTYFEDRIIDHTYGAQSSMFNFMGYQSGNRALTRLEYTGMRNPKGGKVARPGWEIEESYKGFVYSKTATWLHTLEGILGLETMTKIFRSYFQQWRFKHPRGEDFLKVIEEVVTSDHPDLSEAVLSLNNQVLFESEVCDYAVGSIQNKRKIAPFGLFDTADGRSFSEASVVEDAWDSRITLYRLGGIIAPVEVQLVFEDGHSETVFWDGKNRTHILSYERTSPVESVCIDPSHSLYIDLDFNNNSKTTKPKSNPILKYSSKTVFWVQNVLQFLSLLV